MNLTLNGIGLKFKEETMRCYIKSTALYGAERWTLRKDGQKSRKVLKFGAGEEQRRLVGQIV
jgi:hypothetical protein